MGTRGEADGASVAPESEPDLSMNSRVSWSVDGIDPSVRERAEAAARRAGMSLSEWLNSTIGESGPSSFRASPDERPAMPSQESHDVADIHQRLDSITRQIEQISKPAPRSEAARGEAALAEPTVARQLNDAISRLDARLSQITSAGAARQAPSQVAPPADMGKLLLLRMGLRHERNVADWCEEALDMLSALSAHGTNVVPIDGGQRENNG